MSIRVQPPGAIPDPTSTVRSFVQENKDQLNVSATEFNDGEYGTPLTSVPSALGKNNTTSGYGSTNRFKNELEQFASGTHLFTLSVLTARQMAFPDRTYRAGQIGNAILRSGGGLGDTKALTAYESSSRRFEYYIDNVEIESIIAPTNKQRATNATNIKFQVTEPYSMGLFLQTLQVASAAEYKNYLETPMLLTVEFVGQDDNGDFIGSVAKRYFPLKLVSMDMNVTNGGTVYDVEAVPYNEAILSDTQQSVDHDIEITGTSLSELLDTGEQSLAKVINDRYISQIDINQASRPDEVMIIFPQDTAGTKDAAGQSGANASETQSVLYDLTADGVPPVVSVSGGLPPVGDRDDRAQLNANAQQFIAQQASLASKLRENLSSTVNEIGRSRMIDSIDSNGNNPLNRAGLTYNNEKLIFENDKMSISTDLRTFSFPRGSKIQDIIEELILISDYGRQFAEPKPDSNGMVNWFKVETEVYPIIDQTEQSRSGKTPKVKIFKVLPYKIHMSTISSPTASIPNVDQLKSLAAKQYDYIYTGLNNDILDFEINLNNQFFAGVSADGDALSSDSVTSTQSGTSAEGETNLQPSTNGGGSGAQGTVQQVNTHTTGSGGGGGQESVATRVARTFNDAIVNSNVDLLILNFDIMGDPYYLADSGMGNYNSRPGRLYVTQDGQMDYQRSEVDIIVNFRTPVDYNNETGFMDFPQLDTVIIEEFSGLYKVIKVDSSWSGGKFTQKIECIRRRNQENSYTGNSALKTPQTDASELDDTGTGNGSHAASSETQRSGNPTLQEQVNEFYESRRPDALAGARGF